jgi:hypothetical protein
MGARPTAESLTSLANQRDKLAKSMTTFNIDSQKYLGVDALKECLGIIELSTTDFEIDSDPTDPPVNYPDGARPESLSIALPSALPQLSSNRLPLTRFMAIELELRKGHANDCLAAMRASIGQQAYQYKKILKPAHTKTHRTRARSSLQNVYRALILQTRLYIRTRKAMLSLNMDALDPTYKELIKKDINVSSAVADPNVTGSSKTKLSWIWTTHHGVEENDNHLTECELYLNSVCIRLIKNSLSGPLAASKGATTPMARRSHSYKKRNALGNQLFYFSEETMA